MLNPHEQSGLPTIVQVERDCESGRFVALIPASHYPNVPSAVVDPEIIDSLWAGPLSIPSVARDSNRRFPVALKAEWDFDINNSERQRLSATVRTFSVGCKRLLAALAQPEPLTEDETEYGLSSPARWEEHGKLNDVVLHLVAS